MTVTSADEFYSIMGVLTREMLEFTDTNNLIKVKTIIHSLISFKHSLIMIMFPSKDCILFKIFLFFTIILSIINVFDVINNNLFA